MPANGRFTIWVDDEQLPAGSGTKPLANVAVSMTVRSTNGVPMIVERTMWWPGPETTGEFWYEAHNSPGATTTALRWALADGEVAGADGAETYVLIANPDGAARPRPRAPVLRERQHHRALLRPAAAQPHQRRDHVRGPRGDREPHARGRGREPRREPGANRRRARDLRQPGRCVWSRGSNALATPIPDP